jgi:hypothetical protein
MESRQPRMRIGLSSFSGDRHLRNQGLQALDISLQEAIKVFAGRGGGGCQWHIVHSDIVNRLSRVHHRLISMSDRPRRLESLALLTIM